MRFVWALARAQSLPTASGLAVALVLSDRFLGAHLLPVPFLGEAVQAGRVFPALLAGCGALVVAGDWAEHERSGARTPWLLVLGRWLAGGALVAVAAYLAGALHAVVGVLFLGEGLLATLVPRHWWLALPPLLYLQLFLPDGFLPQ